MVRLETSPLPLGSRQELSQSSSVSVSCYRSGFLCTVLNSPALPLRQPYCQLGYLSQLLVPSTLLSVHKLFWDHQYPDFCEWSKSVLLVPIGWMQHVSSTLWPQSMVLSLIYLKMGLYVNNQYDSHWENSLKVSTSLTLICLRYQEAESFCVNINTTLQKLLLAQTSRSLCGERWDPLLFVAHHHHSYSCPSGEFLLS